MEQAATGGGYARGWTDWVVGISYLWQGQVVPACDALRTALTRAEEECGRRSPIAVMLASALATVYWERDSIDEVASLLADRLDVLERRAPPDAIINGYVSAARVATVAGLERRAFDLLEHLHALGEARALPRLQVASLAEQIRMHALRGHNAVCSTLIGRLAGLTPEQPAAQWGILGPSITLQAGLARAYAAVVRQDWLQARAELAAIDPIAERLRRTRDRIQIGLLRALTMKRCGDDAAALFGEALSLAEALGLQRLVVDTHPDLVDWARRVRGVDGGMHAPPPAPKRTRSAAQGRVTPSALLTAKEGEVLQCLAGNLTNKEIALALDVSDETVKWHLKNLFAKLRAANRKHVLGRARMLGILDAVD
jgi:LuxR family maltose regulon positive regulatory protein